MISSRALVHLPQAGALTYSRHAVVNPITISVIAFAAVAGGVSGVLGALVWAAIVVACGAVLGRFGPIRRVIDRDLADAAAEERERRRLEQLEATSPARREQYRVVRSLVAEIEESDPDEARRLEVHDLLDELVGIAVMHARCEAALVAGGELPSTTLSPRARAIVDRRAALSDRCRQRADELSERAVVIEQLVRLAAQRVACAALDDVPANELDERFAELDRLDDALAELSA